MFCRARSLRVLTSVRKGLLFFVVTSGMGSPGLGFGWDDGRDKNCPHTKIVSFGKPAICYQVPQSRRVSFRISATATRRRAPPSRPRSDRPAYHGLIT